MKFANGMVCRPLSHDAYFNPSVTLPDFAQFSRDEASRLPSAGYTVRRLLGTHPLEDMTAGVPSGIFDASAFEERVRRSFLRRSSAASARFALTHLSGPPKGAAAPFSEASYAELFFVAPQKRLIHAYRRCEQNRTGRDRAVPRRVSHCATRETFRALKPWLRC